MILEIYEVNAPPLMQWLSCCRGRRRRRERLVDCPASSGSDPDGRHDNNGERPSHSATTGILLELASLTAVTVVIIALACTCYSSASTLTDPYGHLNLIYTQPLARFNRIAAIALLELITRPLSTRQLWAGTCS
jgi:hypothetical protein